MTSKKVKKIKESDIAEKDVRVEAVCSDCKGTGRGAPIGFQVTSCKHCNGSGK